MVDIVQIKGMSFEAICGVYPEEQLAPQPFEVDIELEADQSKPASTDSIADAIDYGPICEAIVRISKSEKFRLIESMAQRIVDELFSIDPKIDAMTITLRKLHPAMSAKLSYTAVKIRRVRPT